MWLLVPLDWRLVRILVLAGQACADLEDDERAPDGDGEEPSLGSLDRWDQESWSDGISARAEADKEECFVDCRTALNQPKLGRFQRLQTATAGAGALLASVAGEREPLRRGARLVRCWRRRSSHAWSKKGFNAGVAE